MVIGRGIKDTSHKDLVTLFTYDSYYRMSGYWLQYKNTDGSIKDALTFDLLRQIYCFDRDLRILVLRAIQLIENCVRANFIDYYATNFPDPFNFDSLDSDPFAYVYHWYFKMPKTEKTDKERGNFEAKHYDRIERLHKEAKAYPSKFVNHYYTKYYSENYLPVWMAIESSSFGTLVYLCRNSVKQFKMNLGDLFNISHDVFESWLVALRKLRNCAAHHERIWDMDFKYSPTMQPKMRKYPHWHSPSVPKLRSIMYRVLILEYLVSKIPHSHFSVYCELCKIIENYPGVPIDKTGLPEDWKSCHLWHD